MDGPSVYAMDGPSVYQDSHFTIGEAILLLLFSLLLVLAVPLIQTTEKNRELTVKIEKGAARGAQAERAC